MDRHQLTRSQAFLGSSFWSLAIPFMHTASNQKLEPGKAWEQGYVISTMVRITWLACVGACSSYVQGGTINKAVYNFLSWCHSHILPPLSFIPRWLPNQRWRKLWSLGRSQRQSSCWWGCRRWGRRDRHRRTSSDKQRRKSKYLVIYWFLTYVTSFVSCWNPSLPPNLVVPLDAPTHLCLSSY